MRRNWNRKLPALLALICLTGLLSYPVTALGEEASTEILLSFTGDCTLGGEERLLGRENSFHGYIAREGYAYPFAKVQEVFTADDVTVVNLEGVLYDCTENAARKRYLFRGPTDFANIIKASSIELSFLGNNHTFDYGLPGYRSTVAALEGAGLDWFAVTYEGIKTWIYEKNGVKIGFTGANITEFTRLRNELKESICQLQEAGCVFIIASVHGGQEYGPRQDAKIQRFARFFVDHGAGLVIGHHPHVLHGIEVYKGASIVYSLGNFAFGGNVEIRERRTMIAQAALRFDEEGKYLEHQLNLLPAYTSGTAEYNNFQPVLIGGEEAQAIIDLVGTMSDFSLEPFVEGTGAWQLPVKAQFERIEGE